MIKRPIALCIVAAGALAVTALVLLPSAVSAQIPDKFTNLKVFPQDISKKELMDEMKDFAFHLGTRCWFCHEGEGDDLSTFNFASDKKPQKGITRDHIRMTRQINQNFFDGGDATVSCNTCHQGETKPLN